MARKKKTAFALRAGRMVSIPKTHKIVAAAGAGGNALQFCAPLEIKAEAAPAEGHKASPRKFSMVAYNGGAMQLQGYYSPVVVDLAGLQGINKPRPIFKNHDPDQIVGHADKISVKGNSLLATGVISGAGDAVKEVLATHDNGFPWQASIGAKALNMEYVKEGSKATANGQEFNGPINIARKTMLGEISFVPLGADDTTSARIAATAAKGTPMNFEQWLEAKGFNLADLNDAQQASMKASFDLEIAAAKKPKKKPARRAVQNDDDDDPEGLNASGNRVSDDEPQDIQAQIDRDILARRKANATESKRIAQVRQICAGDNITIEVKADDGKTSRVSLEAHAIEAGWDINKVELEALRAKRVPQSAPYINVAGVGGAGALGPDIHAAALTAAMAKSMGVDEKHAFAGLSDPGKELAASKAYRNSGLHQAMFIIAQANGIAYRGRVDDEFLRAMLVHDQQNQIRAADAHGFSTMSLSGILENILNKGMLAQYDAVNSVVADIAYETDTNDFKLTKRYRMTASGHYELVGASGDLANLSLQDESYPMQVSTQGGVTTVTRQVLINDDMGALMQIPQLHGREAAIAREKSLFATLATGKTTVAPGSSTGQAANGFNFFSTGAVNYLTGATSALSIASMTSSRQKFVEQKDANGNPILVVPDRILVAPANETVADNLFQGANIVVGALGSTSSKSTEPNLNAHRNKYRPVMSPFFGSKSPVSGFTDNNFLMLGDPSGGMAVVSVIYLRGQRTPIIERGEVNFNTLGIGIRGYYDFGTQLHDYRCGVWSDGQ